jgi:hypothetical protein
VFSKVRAEPLLVASFAVLSNLFGNAGSKEGERACQQRKIRPLCASISKVLGSKATLSFSMSY